MRILQIVHGNEAGGAKTLSEIIGDGLAAADIAVETVSLFPDPGAGGLGKVAGVLRMARRICVGRYSAIIAYQPTASIVAGVAGRLARCTLRIAHQTALPSEIRVVLRWLDCMLGSTGFYAPNVANSLATVAAFAHYPARYRRAMIMIQHGVPAPRPTRSRAATLERFDVPDDRRILLNVGRLTAQKNQRVLIEALVSLPSARLVVAGGGALRRDYEILAARLGVAERLHLLCDVSRDEIGDLLFASDLFVFPSTWETFGLAVVEAAMAGLPIIAADLPVLREVLSSEGRAAATFVAPFDAGGWVRAIESSAQPGQGSPADVLAAVAQRYSAARMVETYIRLLDGRHDIESHGDDGMNSWPDGRGETPRQATTVRAAPANGE